MKRFKINLSRAKRCAKTLRRYGTDDTDPGCLTDFLADARHWCDQHGHSFGDLDRIAHDHYLAELNDQQTEERKLP